MLDCRSVIETEKSSVTKPPFFGVQVHEFFRVYLIPWNQSFVSRGKDGCTPNVRVLPWLLLCSTLGFLGIITDKYPRAIGLIFRDFPWRATLGVRGTSFPIPWLFSFASIYLYGCQPKNNGKYPPNHPIVKIGVLNHYFHRPFWGTPIFWKHPYI